MNASFYLAWMMTNFASVAPMVFMIVLYVVGAADRSVLAQKTLITIRLSLLAGTIASGVIIIVANQLLGLLGDIYVTRLKLSLRILALAVFPITIKSHYVAISRVNDSITEAAGLMAMGGMFELI